MRAYTRRMPLSPSDLLELVARHDGLSSARACKQLQVSRSELLRLLALLGDDPGLGGLDLVRVQQEDGRETLWLTERARAAHDAS
jgi:hypothetical protein